MLLPVWITSLPRMEKWDYHYNDLLNQHKKHQYNNGENNFKIHDSTKAWDNLYLNFLTQTKKILGPLNIDWNHPQQRLRNCWLYPTNRHHYRGGIHNHLKTSTVNAVYYFSVPESTDYYDSAISFYDTNYKEIWTYKPKEQDLIIMPNYLNHQPLPTQSEKYRFSINMEIICDWPEKFGTKNSS